MAGVRRMPSRGGNSSSLERWATNASQSNQATATSRLMSLADSVDRWGTEMFFQYCRNGQDSYESSRSGSDEKSLSSGCIGACKVFTEQDEVVEDRPVYMAGDESLASLQGSSARGDGHRGSGAAPGRPGRQPSSNTLVRLRSPSTHPRADSPPVPRRPSIPLPPMAAGPSATPRPAGGTGRAQSPEPTAVTPTTAVQPVVADSDSCSTRGSSKTTTQSPPDRGASKTTTQSPLDVSVNFDQVEEPSSPQQQGNGSLDDLWKMEMAVAAAPSVRKLHPAASATRSRQSSDAPPGTRQVRRGSDAARPSPKRTRESAKGRAIAEARAQAKRPTGEVAPSGYSPAPTEDITGLDMIDSPTRRATELIAASQDAHDEILNFALEAAEAAGSDEED